MIWGVQSPSRAEKLESEPSRVTYKRHWARFTHVIIEGGFILFILALLSGQTQEMRTKERSDSNWRQSLCSNEFLIDFEWEDNSSSDLMLCYGFVGLRDPRQQFLVIFLTFLCCRSLSRLKGVLLWKLAGFFMPLRRQTSFWRCCCQKWTQHVFPVDQSHFWSHERCPERLQSAPEALSQREHNADAPGGISGLDCIFFCEGSKAKKVENHWCNLWRCIVICYVC